MKTKPDLILELSQKVEALEQAQENLGDHQTRLIAERLVNEINKLNEEIEALNGNN